jgi:hypothetical protein
MSKKAAAHIDAEFAFLFFCCLGHSTPPKFQVATVIRKFNNVWCLFLLLRSEKGEGMTTLWKKRKDDNF